MNMTKPNEPEWTVFSFVCAATLIVILIIFKQGVSDVTVQGALGIAGTFAGAAAGSSGNKNNGNNPFFRSDSSTTTTTTNNPPGGGENGNK